jgi:sn-glycerol 3-phosphate transport system permease protein
VNAWLLLLPRRLLLVPSRIIRSWPPSGTSFFIPRRSGGELFVGFDNFRAMFEDAIFWKALTNNFWFALGTVPTSIALALLMALWVNRNMRGRDFCASPSSRRRYCR